MEARLNSPPRILVTGGASPIGRALQSIGPSYGIDIVPVSGPRSAAPPGSLVADVRDVRAMKEIVASVQPASIIHLAWIRPQTSGDELAAARENEDAAMALGGIARAAGVGRLVFASSAAIYGDRYQRPVAEEDEPRPSGGYGAAKLQVEQSLRSITGRDLAIIAARIFNVYGPGMHSSLVERLRHLRDEAGDLELELRGPDNFVRDYIAVHDVAAALLLAARASTTEFLPINIATGIPTSNRRLADFFGVSGLPNARFIAGPDSYSCAVVDRARATIGFVSRRPPWA